MRAARAARASKGDAAVTGTVSAATSGGGAGGGAGAVTVLPPRRPRSSSSTRSGSRSGSAGETSPHRVPQSPAEFGAVESPSPQSTPRRRLSAALVMDQKFLSSPESGPDSLDAQLRKAFATQMTPRTAPGDGEQLIHRAGKKISGRYALCTLIGGGRKLRVVVYLVDTCEKFQMQCTLPPGGEPAESKTTMASVLSSLVMDPQGKVTLADDFPATWVAL